MGSLERYTPCALGALRIVAALIFLEHGTQKLIGFPAAPEGGLPPMGSLFWVGDTPLQHGYRDEYLLAPRAGQSIVAYVVRDKPPSP